MFSKNLKYLREKNGMEQIDLAKRLGRKSSSSVSEWESSKYTPKIGVLNDIAEIFSVSISDLMNKDLSKLTSSENANKCSNNKTLLINTFEKLTASNQEKVIEYADQQLTKQNNQRAFSLVAEDTAEYHTLAAHAVDPEKKYSKADIQKINDVLDELDRKYDKK